jgi:hypothetical protein
LEVVKLVAISGGGEYLKGKINELVINVKKSSIGELYRGR